MFSVGFQCAAGSENCGPHPSECTFNPAALVIVIEYFSPFANTESPAQGVQQFANQTVTELFFYQESY